MKNTGTLRIQTFAARQSAPMEGVTVAVQGDGFTLHCITDATGSAADIPIEAPACTLSLDEDNTIRPYAVVSLTAAKSGYRTVRIEGIQIFCRADHTGTACDDSGHGGRQGHPERAHRHPAAPFVCGQRRQRCTAGGKLHAPGAGQGDHPQKHHGASGQTGRLSPQRDRVLPGLYRQCRLQRGIPHLG